MIKSITIKRKRFKDLYGEWEEVSFDDYIEFVTKKINKIRDTHDIYNISILAHATVILYDDGENTTVVNPKEGTS